MVRPFRHCRHSRRFGHCRVRCRPFVVAAGLDPRHDPNPLQYNGLGRCGVRCQLRRLESLGRHPPHLRHEIHAKHAGGLESLDTAGALVTSDTHDLFKSTVAAAGVGSLPVREHDGRLQVRGGNRAGASLLTYRHRRHCGDPSDDGHPGQL